MQLNPARGRKPISMRGYPRATQVRFMQLNPARGRKLFKVPAKGAFPLEEVYAAQPREGTETLTIILVGFHTKRVLVYAAQPREGTETLADLKSVDCVETHGLCSSTPRGDGNLLISIIPR